MCNLTTFRYRQPFVATSLWISASFTFHFLLFNAKTCQVQQSIERYEKRFSNGNCGCCKSYRISLLLSEQKEREREREKDSSIYVLFVILSNPFLIFLTKIPFGQNWPCQRRRRRRCSPIELARHYREECQRGKGQSAEAGRDKKNVFEHTENAWLAENVEPTTVQLISN